MYKEKTLKTMYLFIHKEKNSKNLEEYEHTKRKNKSLMRKVGKVFEINLMAMRTF